MLPVMLISIFGLIFSAVVHLCIIFNICDPPRGLLMLIQGGVVAVITLAINIHRKVCGKTNIKDFINTIFNVCPRWMSVMTGLLIVYGLAGLIYFIKLYFDSPVTTERIITHVSFRGFSAHWMALYSLTFTTMYYCRKLVKNNKR